MAWLVVVSVAFAVRDIPFKSFLNSCERSYDGPLRRFWGSRPHPDLSMISDSAFWQRGDKNLAVLPRWRMLAQANDTIPFTDTHVAVRFLGGVSNYSVATSPVCQDSLAAVQPSTGVDRAGRWCDLVVRDSTGALKTRFDLVRSRLDRYFNAGIGLMIVMDDVPWAFVNITSEACQNFGCQYLPPNNPQEFADWIGTLAVYLRKSYGLEYASRIRWRLGTEANGPRWSDRGKYYAQYLDSYKRTMKSIRDNIPGAKVGASNWVEVVGNSGDLSKNGTDNFQYKFYSDIGKDESVPLDWISVSHYGGGRQRKSTKLNSNFPGPDWVARTHTGAVEVQEMKALAAHRTTPNDQTLEVQEWSVLKNEMGQPTWEPSSLGTAWSAASATIWMCQANLDQIFHWETGTTLRNSSGDGRLVNFYEQWPWNMAMLEMFREVPHSVETHRKPSRSSSKTDPTSARFLTYDLPESDPNSLNNTVTVIESVVLDTTPPRAAQRNSSAVYYALISAVAHDRKSPFRTRFMTSTDAFAGSTQKLAVEQWRMNSSYSVTETIVRELTAANKTGLLVHDDGLPYDSGRLLTSAGREWAQKPENLERFWALQAAAFQPHAYEGTWQRVSDREVEFEIDITAPSVTVIRAREVGRYGK